MLQKTQAEHLPDLTGTFVDDGRLELTKLLGAGAYGRIYHARETTTPSNPTIYAVKCIKRPARRSQSQAKFQSRERHLQARVSRHPNVLTLHHCFTSPDHVFMLFDLCTGGDLFAALLDGVFTGQPKLVKRIFSSLVDGVLFCHRKGVYHRDIKPENVLFNLAQGEVLLADFGLSTAEAVSTEMDCGSPAYMPPESFSGNNRTSYAPADSDKWALCMLLLNLVCGMNPWSTSKDDYDHRWTTFLQTSFAVHPRSLLHPTHREYIYTQPKLGIRSLEQNFLRCILAISIPLTRILVKALTPDPTLRPSLETIRTEVLAMELSMGADDLLAAGAISNCVPAEDPEDDGDDSDASSDGEFLGQSAESEVIEVVEIEVPALIPTPLLAVGASPNPQEPVPAVPLIRDRFINAVRRVSISSSIRKARRASDASSFANNPMGGGALALPVPVVLPAPTSDDSSSVDEEGRLRIAEKVVGRKASVRGGDSLNRLMGKLQLTWPRAASASAKRVRVPPV
ncbi:kinase-like domain-containing protein [Mycena amicta]|nr:kinase-like domain-containing protein [Mycena amicta]